MIDEEFVEHPDLGRQVVAVLISDVHRQHRELPVEQHRHQAPCRDVLLHDVERLDEDTEAGDGRLADHLPVIAVEGCADSDDPLRIPLVRRSENGSAARL